MSKVPQNTFELKERITIRIKGLKFHTRPSQSIISATQHACPRYYYLNFKST